MKTLERLIKSCTCVPILKRIYCCYQKKDILQSINFAINMDSFEWMWFIHSKVFIIEKLSSCSLVFQWSKRNLWKNLLNLWELLLDDAADFARFIGKFLAWITFFLLGKICHVYCFLNASHHWEFETYRVDWLSSGRYGLVLHVTLH